MISSTCLKVADNAMMVAAALEQKVHYGLNFYTLFPMAGGGLRNMDTKLKQWKLSKISSSSVKMILINPYVCFGVSFFSEALVCSPAHFLPLSLLLLLGRYIFIFSFKSYDCSI